MKPGFPDLCGETLTRCLECPWRWRCFPAPEPDPDPEETRRLRTLGGGQAGNIIANSWKNR
jgi:hypothetical protein